MKSKYTLRTNLRRKIPKVKPINTVCQKTKPYIPRKLIRIMTLLRHENFLRLVQKFFKPATIKYPAWNFEHSTNVTEQNKTSSSLTK